MSAARQPGKRTPSGGRPLVRWALAASFLCGGLAPSASASDAGAQDAVRQVINSYEKAIETKDLDLFRAVKPNLSGDEERRLQAAFGSTGSHDVVIEILSVQVQGKKAVAQLARRDTLEGSIVSSFPQRLELVMASNSWVIEAIGR